MLFRQPIESWESDEVLWIEYKQASETSLDKYLCFEGQILNTAYFMTDPEEKIMIAGGGAKKISKADSRALIERITKKYGKPEHKRASFSGEYDLYTWTLQDRTIQYAVVFTDESNVLKIEIERNEKGELMNLSERKRESYFNGYIFIINAPWVKKIHSAGEATGDFVYCQ